MSASPSYICETCSELILLAHCHKSQTEIGMGIAENLSEMTFNHQNNQSFCNASNNNKHLTSCMYWSERQSEWFYLLLLVLLACGRRRLDFTILVWIPKSKSFCAHGRLFVCKLNTNRKTIRLTQYPIPSETQILPVAFFLSLVPCLPLPPTEFSHTTQFHHKILISLTAAGVNCLYIVASRLS